MPVGHHGSVPSPQDVTPAEPEPPVPGGSDLLALLQDANVEQQRYERALAARLGIDRTSLEVVHQLVVQGPSSPTALARPLGLSPAVTTQALNRLEAAGHVHRHPHPDDGRKIVVTLDPATSQRVHTVLQPLLTRLDQAVAAFPARDRAAVARFLELAGSTYRETRPE